MITPISKIQDATYALSNAKVIQSAADAVKAGYMKMVVIGGSTPVITIVGKSTLKFKATPQLIAELNNLVSNRLSELALALIADAQKSLTPPPTTGTPINANSN